MRRCTLLALLLGFVTVINVRAADDERLKADEQLFREAGLATDGPKLIEFFQARTAGDRALESVEKLVRDLGSDSFKVRENGHEELLKIGPQALLLLRRAIGHDDPEVSFRARSLVVLLERSVKPELMGAAVRLLAARKPAGAVKALLDYLPSSTESLVVEEIHTALAAVGIQQGKVDEELRKALDDRQAVRRAAAADAIIRAGTAADRKALAKLLKDTDPRVRTIVAVALVETKDREAIAPMIELLTEAPPELFWKIESLLFALAGEDAPRLSPGSSDLERREYRTAWKQWWTDKGAKVDLASLDLARRTLGLTLIIQMDQRGAVGAPRVVGQGRVYEVGPDGKPRWEIKDLNYPIDAEIVGKDRVLIAEYRSRQVTERNFKGEILWTKAINNYPVGVQRLENGNTLIATRTEVIETKPNGEDVLRIPPTGGNVTAAKRLRNGETLIVESNGGLRYVDAKGKDLRRVNVGGPVGAIIGSNFDVLPNGNVLLPLYTQNKTIEVDKDGKTVWEHASQRPTAAMRLANGNTIIASRYVNTVVEIDRAGKKVWEHSSDTGLILNAKRR